MSTTVRPPSPASTAPGPVRPRAAGVRLSGAPRVAPALRQDAVRLSSGVARAASAASPVDRPVVADRRPAWLVTTGKAIAWMGVGSAGLAFGSFVTGALANSGPMMGWSVGVALGGLAFAWLGTLLFEPAAKPKPPAPAPEAPALAAANRLITYHDGGRKGDRELVRNELDRLSNSQYGALDRVLQPDGAVTAAELVALMERHGLTAEVTRTLDLHKRVAEASRSKFDHWAPLSLFAVTGPACVVTTLMVTLTISSGALGLAALAASIAAGFGIYKVLFGKSAADRALLAQHPEPHEIMNALMAKLAAAAAGGK